LPINDFDAAFSLFPTRCYVAVASSHAEKALDALHTRGIKGRKLRVKAIG